MNYPNVTDNISKDISADDLTSAGKIVEEVGILKKKCEELFKKGGFNLHKWHSPSHFKNKFVKWVRDTSSLKNEIARSMGLNKEPITITTVDLNVFGDTSIVASCAVVYAVVHQPLVTNQGLVVSKFRISKKNFSPFMH